MGQKAKRLATRLRIALTGPSGSGKTYSALRIAYGMIKATYPDFTDEQIWDKIYLIDTERGRGLAYADRTDLPLQTGEYWYGNIESPYTVKKYVNEIDEALKTVGENGIIIVDSLTHAWNGKGGLLDKKAELDSRGGNSYTNWKVTGDEQNELVDKLMNLPVHLICTMRSKMAYELEKDPATGKNVPTKIGLKPVQRDELEYEFDITLQLSKEHDVAMITKDITFLDSQNFNEVLTEEVGANLVRWANQGTDPKQFLAEKHKKVMEELQKIGTEHPDYIDYFHAKYGENVKLKDLSYDEAEELLQDFKEMLK